MESEPGLERRSRSRGPELGTEMESEPGLERGRTLGAGAREKEWEPGPERRRMQ